MDAREVRPTLSKEEIRSLAEEWIACGLSAREMAALRAELADSANVDRRSLGSVFAYVRYSATRALKAVGLEGELDRDSLVCASRYLDLAKGPDDYSDTLQELCQTFGVHPDALRDAVRLYHSEVDRKPVGVMDATPDCGPKGEAPEDDVQCPAGREDGPAQEASENPIEDLILPPPGGDPGLAPTPITIEVVEDHDCCEDLDEVSGRRGDEVDYNFRTKVAWRRELEDYLRDHMSPRMLRDAKVICLPGKDVEPEVSIYLRLGVRPENILAVEGGRKPARQEFEANAQRMGIGYRIGRLEKLLPSIDQKFDIVSYDFHGPMCKGHCQVILDTPVSDRAILLYNAMAKRESRDIQDSFNISTAMTGVRLWVRPDGDRFLKNWVVHGKVFQDWEDAVAFHRETSTLQMYRDEHFGGIHGALGGSRHRKASRLLEDLSRNPQFAPWFEEFPLGTVAALLSQHVGSFASRATYSLVRALESEWGKGILHSLPGLPVSDFLTRLGLELSMSSSPRLLGYHSEANGGRSQSPYYSTFGVTHRPDALAAECSETLEFLSSVVSFFINSRPDEMLCYSVEGPESRSGRKAQSLIWSDRLVAEFGGNEAAISIGTLLSQLNHFASYRSRHDLTGPESSRRRIWIR